LLLSPNAEDAEFGIHQDAWFHLGKFDKGVTTTYSLKKKAMVSMLLSFPEGND
jgi:hypothetical protein